MQTNSSPTWTIADRFSQLIELLGRSLGVHGNRCGIRSPLLLVAWVRIRRLAKLFARIEARLRAGTLVTRPRRPSATPRTPRPYPPPPDRLVPYLPPGTLVPVLPRGFGWLNKMVPGMHMSAAALCALLQTPEMRARFAEAPQLGRVLRPLAHILGLKLTVLGTELLPGLELPRKPRIRKPTPKRKRTRRARPQATDTVWPQPVYEGPPWRTRADAMGIPRKIRT